MAKIAGRLMGQRMPPFEDTGALHDPIGIETQSLMQLFIRDHDLGHIAAAAENPYPRQTAAARTNMRRSLFIAHNRVNPLRPGQGANRSRFPVLGSRKDSLHDCPKHG